MCFILLISFVYGQPRKQPNTLLLMGLSLLMKFEARCKIHKLHSEFSKCASLLSKLFWGLLYSVFPSCLLLEFVFLWGLMDKSRTKQLTKKTPLDKRSKLKIVPLLHRQNIFSKLSIIRRKLARRKSLVAYKLTTLCKSQSLTRGQNYESILNIWGCWPSYWLMSNFQTS